MSDNLMLDFPVLKKGGGDFKEEISYEVEATQVGGNLQIKHTVNGNSFVRQAIESGDAKFSVSLLYRDSSERQSHTCDTDIIKHDDAVTATQIIPVTFSYAPEITPSIVLLNTTKISVNSASGLTDFWEQGEQFEIPNYSRIALGPKLKFTSGDLSNLMEVRLGDKFDVGEMKVVINEHADEGKAPVTLWCGQGVYDQLHKVTNAEPGDAIESMRSAIITNALCAIYAYMHKKSQNSDYEASGVLAAHLEQLQSRTNEDWEHEDFNPSLAATKMQPYAIKALNGEADRD